MVTTQFKKYISNLEEFKDKYETISELISDPKRQSQIVDVRWFFLQLELFIKYFKNIAEDTEKSKSTSKMFIEAYTDTIVHNKHHNRFIQSTIKVRLFKEKICI